MKSEEVRCKLAAASLNFFKCFVLQIETACIYNERESPKLTGTVSACRFLLITFSLFTPHQNLPKVKSNSEKVRNKLDFANLKLGKHTSVYKCIEM